MDVVHAQSHKHRKMLYTQISIHTSIPPNPPTYSTVSYPCYSLNIKVDPNLSEEDLDGIIAEIDEDGSGTMDFDEFCEMMMTSPDDQEGS